MKKNEMLLTVQLGGFRVENVKLFNGAFRVYVYNGNKLCEVLKAGSMAGNQNNLKQAARIAGII